MKQKNLQKGISLIEVIIYVAIFSIFVVGLVQFSNTLTSARLHAQGVLEVNNQGSQIIQLITQTLRHGISVNSPMIGNSASTLNISTDISATNPTVFSENDGVLYITEGSGSPIALTNNLVLVSDLSFSNLSQPDTPNIIKINFTLTSVDARDPYSATFSGSSALRK